MDKVFVSACENVVAYIVYVFVTSGVGATVFVGLIVLSLLFGCGCSQPNHTIDITQDGVLYEGDVVLVREFLPTDQKQSLDKLRMQYDDAEIASWDSDRLVREMDAVK